MHGIGGVAGTDDGFSGVDLDAFATMQNATASGSLPRIWVNHWRRLASSCSSP